MVRRVAIVISMIALQACSDAFEFSPNQEFSKNSIRDMNAKNIARLAKNTKDTITIAFIGDSQRFYNDVEKFVNKANTIEEIDFVLLAGDISDFGLLNEFNWVTDRLTKLKMPYIGVVGNHDVVANGENVFQRMFGPLNQSFIYDSVKFILHNTNSREYVGNNVPDLEWLEQELSEQPGVKYQIAVSHVPPFADGDFNPALEQDYSKLFAETPNFLISLHGHIHNHKDYYPYKDGVRYITSPSFDQRSFVLLKIANGNVVKTLINY